MAQKSRKNDAAAIKALVDAKLLKNLSHAIKKKFISKASLAELTNKPISHIRSCLIDPTNFTMRDIVDLSNAFGITHQQAIDLVWNDVKMHLGMKK